MKTWKDDAREGGKFHDRLIICTVKYNYFYFFLNTIELHIKNNYSMINQKDFLSARKYLRKNDDLIQSKRNIDVEILYLCN